MSERLDKRLSDAKHLEDALWVACLGSDHSERLVKMIECLETLRAFPADAPRALQSRRKKVEELGELMLEAWVSDSAAIHALSEMKAASPKTNSFWYHLIRFARIQTAKFEAGIRKVALSRKELADESKKYGNCSERQLDYLISILKKHGVPFAKRTK